MYKRIACIGGATLDHTVEPLGRLRAGTSNPVRSETCSGGTARNVAEALARLGCRVALFSRVGDDGSGERVLGELEALGVDLAGVDRAAGRPTASYTAILDEHRELAMGLADMEILDELDEGWLDGRLDRLAACDLWIIDANLPAIVIERLVRRRPDGTRIYADPVSVEKSSRLGPALDRIHTIFPDRHEAAALCGADAAAVAGVGGAHPPAAADPGGADSLATGASDGDDPMADGVSGRSGTEATPGELAAALLERGLRRVLITLGADGVWVADPPRHERVPAVGTSAVVNVTGAGDCFLAGYVFAQARRPVEPSPGPARPPGEPGTQIDPVRCGLAAAAFAVESRRTVPAELTAERLLERCRDAP